jgi:NADPH2:quinone reductase
MRAVIGSKLGALDELRCTEVEVPKPQAGEVRLRVNMVGLGYVDGLIAEGKYQIKPDVPFTPGGEMAGTIDALGDGVSGLAVGDRVASWVLSGGLAEFSVVPARTVHRIGPTLDFAKAAALTLNYATALHALRDRAHLANQESLLVLGAAGGVGSAAIEVGRRLGAWVIAAASTNAKREFARSLGAQATVDYTDPDWRHALRDVNSGKGIDVVFDPVGGNTFEPAFRSLGWGGRHLVIGFTGGPIPALRANLALLKGASLVGADIRQFSEKDPEQAGRNLADLYAWADSGALRVPLHGIYPLDRFAEALTVATSGATQGKVVVQVG